MTKDNVGGVVTMTVIPTQQPDLVCLSHLRWDFVYQRPQHLLSRCARERRVFFVEAPIPYGSGCRASTHPVTANGKAIAA
jgi:ribonuclease BN (tRNA processing enzyme)